MITGLFHIAINSRDVERSRRFYTEVLGLQEAPRPNLGVPGYWLKVPGPLADSIIHIIGTNDASAGVGEPRGSGWLDHISLAAIGYRDYVARFRRFGLEWKENVIPDAGLWQLFVRDPCGVQVELTFSAAAETGGEPVIPPERRYVPGTWQFRVPEEG